MTKHTIRTENQLQQEVDELQAKLFSLQQKTAVSPCGKVTLVGEYRITEKRIYMIDLSGYPVYEAPRHIRTSELGTDVQATESVSVLGLIKWPERAGYGSLYQFFADVLNEQGWEVLQEIQYVRNNDCFSNVISRHSVSYKKRFFTRPVHKYRHKETGYILETGYYRRMELEVSDIRNKRLSLKRIREKGYDAKTAAAIHQAWNNLREAVTAKSEEHMNQLKKAASFRPEYGDLLKKHGWQIDVIHGISPKNNQPVVMITFTVNGRSRTCRKENFIPKLLDSMGFCMRGNADNTEELLAELEQLIRRLYPELNEWV